MSSAGVMVLGTPAPVEEEATRKAREQKMAKLRKEKEKAEKEAEKARDDSAMRHQLELVQRITLIETTHARIEAEAREKEKKERREEEKKKAAQGKRASQAAWAPARPSSIRAADED